MTTLRQRMIKELTIRDLTENTQKSYLHTVSALALHYNRSPDLISANEIQDYLIYLHEERHLSWKSCNAARHGLRFFYRNTLQLPDAHYFFQLPRAFQATADPQR